MRPPTGLQHKPVMPRASAELLLVRMRAKVDDICRQRDALRKADGEVR
jgi:hypothetical protein